MDRTNVLRWSVMVATWACLAVAWVATGLASPVIDEEELLRGFAEKLGQLADQQEAIAGAALCERVAAVKGATAPLPENAARRAIVAEGPVYDAVLPAVVALGCAYKCERCSNWHIKLLGTGWIASPDGLVVTCQHCLVEVPAEAVFGVMTSYGDVFAITDVAAVDVSGDAAAVRIDTRGRELPCLALGEPPACGMPVSVLGHPVNRLFFYTEGVVSQYRRWTRRDMDPSAGVEPRVWVSVTADISPGSSGGPVFDSAGRVVGMASRIEPAIVSMPVVTPPQQVPSTTGTNGDAQSAPPANGQPASGPAVPGMPNGDAAGLAVGMVIRDCVSVDTLRSLLGSAEKPGT